MKGNRTMKRNSIPDRVFRPALMLALPLALVALVALGLTIQAGSGPFDGSSVVPTADEVKVGDELGFALYVVNSGPVTVTDALVWNPLPPGTGYIGASGGAFPITGGVMTGVPVSIPLEGRAYDVRLHASVPLTDTGDVTGIAWVGDVPPGGMQVLGLIVVVNNPAGRYVMDDLLIYDDRELAGRFSGQTWVRPYACYLPFYANHAGPPMPTPTPTPTPPPTLTTMTFTIPYGQGLGSGGGSLDPDYWQALAGSDLRFGDGDVYLGQSPPDGPYIPWYVIGRAYAGYDTASLPDDMTILSATLVLDVGCNPPTMNFGTTVYRGVWTPPLGEDDWDAVGDQVAGAWHTADYPCSACPSPFPCLVRIEIDPAAVNREGLTLLEMRSDQEGTPPTVPEQVLINRSADFPALVIAYREER